jgi:polyisoprenoid-binding protein YceI
MAVLTEARTELPTGTWALDPVHSTIGFELPYMAGTFRGQFRDVDARLTPDRLSGTARVASIDVKDENLAAHLQSPEFFDAERHPELTFASTSIERTADELHVGGDITIRGVTRPVTLRVEFVGVDPSFGGRAHAGFTARTEIDREDFGMTWNVALETGGWLVARKVVIEIEAEIIRSGGAQQAA